MASQSSSTPSTFTSRFAWDGTEDLAEVVSYTQALGARDTTAGAACILPLSRRDAEALVALYRRRNANCLIPEVADAEYATAKATGTDLARRIDDLLRSNSEDGEGGGATMTTSWFVKTNRHSVKVGTETASAGVLAHSLTLSHSQTLTLSLSLSFSDGLSLSHTLCLSHTLAVSPTKDAPLDDPTESDAALFRDEMGRRGLVQSKALDQPLDDIDFGPAFEAFCSARLRAIAVRSGEKVLDLFSRSKVCHDDLDLQLSHCPERANEAAGGAGGAGDAGRVATPNHHPPPPPPCWDCYLAFQPFLPSVAATPLHEFRCFVSGGKVRGIGQYSYLATCPIPGEDMPRAGRAMAAYVTKHCIPSLP